MIGQVGNINCIKIWQKNDCFPRFMIITGQQGAGKKTLANVIAGAVGGFVSYPGKGVEDVRATIESAYRCTHPTVYIFPDADKMSPQAKNSMLKITEEPPKKAYFVLTLQDMNNTLNTLKSRGTEIKMEPYTKRDIEEFAKSVGIDSQTITKYATTPGQVLQLNDVGADEFISFCIKVLDNIATVTGTNAFKIGQNFKFKEEEEGYDPILFLDCLSTICKDRVYDDTKTLMESVRYANSVCLCTKYKNELQINGIKKDATFDMFILDMRKVWREGQV